MAVTEPEDEPYADRAPRRACCLIGQLSFGDARNRIWCDIVNMSATGAGICVRERGLLNDRMRDLKNRRIALLMQSDQCIVDCEVVWHDRDRAGLRFKSHFRPMADFGRPQLID
ncbi:MAG: PilZ domain-containing protein [Pseudomonadota bacterium]